MDKETLETGLRIRTEVLGKDYVENSMKNADDFNRPFQEFVSPRLGIRFEMTNPEMTMYRPDGKRFLSFEEVQDGLGQSTDPTR